MAFNFQNDYYIYWGKSSSQLTLLSIIYYTMCAGYLPCVLQEGAENNR